MKERKVISRFLRLDDEIIQKFKNENIGCQGRRDGRRGKRGEES